VLRATTILLFWPSWEKLVLASNLRTLAPSRVCANLLLISS
jgi:hypothetical protein